MGYPCCRPHYSVRYSWLSLQVKVAEPHGKISEGSKAWHQPYQIIVFEVNKQSVFLFASLSRKKSLARWRLARHSMCGTSESNICVPSEPFCCSHISFALSEAAAEMRLTSIYLSQAGTDTLPAPVTRDDSVMNFSVSNSLPSHLEHQGTKLTWHQNSTFELWAMAARLQHVTQTTRTIETTH